MSKAEEIVAEYRGINKHQIAGRNQMLVDAIEEYAQSQLQELRDMMRKRLYSYGFSDSYHEGYNQCEKDVLNLIDQLQKD